MQIFNISVPDKPLTNIELVRYARLLKIPDFRCVFMRDALPKYPFNVESGIVNFNTSNQPGCQWVCYYRNKIERIYFDSYGQITLVEIQRYLKTGSEFDRGREVIQRNTDIAQASSTPLCGHLCLIVLKSLASGEEFQSILNHMQHYGYPQGDWKDSVFKPKIPGSRFTGPYNLLHLQLDSKDNPLPGNKPYNAVDATSMRHDICYRDYPTGKHECDRKMLAELNTLVPKGRREKVDRQLVRSIIGLKHRLGLGIWSNQLASELHKSIRRRFGKRTVFAKQVDDIWAADLIDMSPFSRSNKGYKYLLTVIDVYSKYGWIVALKTKTGQEVAQAFQKLLLAGHPSCLWTDKCTEFYNRHLKAVLEANNVLLYSTENEEKSSVAERWNRTMKNMM